LKRHIFDVDEKSYRDVAGIRSTHGPVFLKRYAGQRLYRPAAGTYLTRGDLMTMVKNGFVVIDARHRK
jgi:polyhydroxyalkanoate synthesis regulator protein